MKTSIVMLFLVFTVAISLSQTQGDGRATFDKSDKKLNDAYQMLLAVKRSDTAFVKDLRASQRAWVQFRDAEVALKFPNQASVGKNDSLPTNVANLLVQLTDDRTRALLEMLKTATGGLVNSPASNSRVYDGNPPLAGPWRLLASLIQMGSVSVSHASRPTNDQWTLVYDTTITFSRRFPRPPSVFLSLSGIEAYTHRPGVFYRLEAEEVSSASFQLRIFSAYMVSFSNCTVTWTALVQE